MKINTDFIAAIQNHLQQLRQLHAKSIRGKPWFILIGPSRAGKTSFLRHAELAVQHILTPDDSIIQTWICENALYLDIQTKTIESAELQQTWEAISNVVRENKGRVKQGGLLLLLPLHDLMNQTKLQRDVLIADYKAIAENFAEVFSSPLAIYTIFSQCDRINGFCEFFNDLDRAQRQTPCGFILHSQQHPRKHEFSDEFDQLLKNFHATLIHRLHRVHNPQERARINDFALQFESVKDIITDTVSHFNDPDSLLENRGCFFISNLQDGAAEDRLSKSLEHTFTLKTMNAPSQPYNPQAYFTHQIATKIIPQDQSGVTGSNNKNPWLSTLGAHAVTIGLSGSIVLVLTVTFLHQRDLILEADQQLAYYQSHKPNLGSKLSTSELRTLIDSLSQLQQTETKIARSNKLWPNLFPFSRLSKTTSEFDQAYRQELSQELYARFASFIDHTLNELGNDEVDASYSTLKAYLMLGSSEHRQSEYLINWLAQRMDVSEIKEKLTPMLGDNGVQMTLNQETIAEARNFLAGLPPATLGVLILKSESTINPTDHVPFIFTKDGYLKTANEQIPNIAKLLLAGDWVLGQTAVPHDSNAATLTAEIRKQYPIEYVKWWQQFLVSVDFPPIQTLEEAVAALQKVTDAQSHLVSMLEQLRQQTSPMTGSDALSMQFNNEIANQFAAFDTGSYQHLGSINGSFKELYTGLLAIMNSPDQNAAALHFVQDAFKSDSHSGIASLIHQSEHLPSPLNLWVTQVVDECWQVVLPKAKAQLETVWHDQVASEYAQLIDGRYPVSAHAKTELPLTAFNHFFAPHGTLDLFFTQHLKEFINTESPTWKTKQLGALEFPLDPQLLETLVRAKLIRQMFFPNQSTEAKIGFQLTPLRLDPIIKDLVMDIDGQSLFAYPGSAKSVHLTWPGNHGQINLVFNNIDGSKSFVSETGPWAWFKLLSKVDIRRMESPQEFQVTFNLNGNAARYQLTADTVVNPYLANIVTGFNLPGDLFLHEKMG